MASRGKKTRRRRRPRSLLTTPIRQSTSLTPFDLLHNFFSTVDKILIDSACRAVPLQQNLLSNKLASRFDCRQIISAGYHLTIMLFHFFYSLPSLDNIHAHVYGDGLTAEAI